jgi:hypothetical protein
VFPIQSYSSRGVVGHPPGQVTLTATANAGSPAAQGQVTVLSQASYPPGTPVWSASPVAGFSPLQLAQAVPSGTGPDLYSTQLSADGTQTNVANHAATCGEQ